MDGCSSSRDVQLWLWEELLGLCKQTGNVCTLANRSPAATRRMLLLSVQEALRGGDGSKSVHDLLRVRCLT